MTFKEGQSWMNPEGLTMSIVRISNGWIHYQTADNEFGKSTVKSMQDWLEMGAIEEIKQ